VSFSFSFPVMNFHMFSMVFKLGPFPGLSMTRQGLVNKEIFYPL
jgi:hypothetical protein